VKKRGHLEDLGIDGRIILSWNILILVPCIFYYFYYNIIKTFAFIGYIKN